MSNEAASEPVHAGPDREASSWVVPGMGTPGERGETRGSRSGRATIPTPTALMEMTDELAALAQGAQDMSGAEVEGLVVGLVRLRSALDAHTATVARAWRDRGDWQAGGSRSPAAALSRDTGTPKHACAALLRRAERVHETMPHTEKAWVSGEISTEGVDLLTQANSPAREPIFARDETVLVDTLRHGNGLLFSQATKAITYWRNHADALLSRDGVPTPRRHLSVATTFDGAVSITGTLDPAGGAILKHALDSLAAQFRRDDLSAHPTETSAGDGLGTSGGHRGWSPGMRTQGERLADALVELATRAASVPHEARRPRIALQVILGADQFAHLCETAGGTVLHPEDLAHHVNDATVQFFRFSPDGTPEAATRTRDFQRFYRGTLRTAIQLRDRHCQHESQCDEPITRCDLDHHDPWATMPTGTTLANGRLLCTAHNRLPQLRYPQRC